MMARRLVAIGFLATLWFGDAAAATAGTFPAATLNDLTTIRNRVWAAQFLSRATFGPTLAEIDALAAEIQIKGQRQAFEDWIDQQFNKPISYHESLATTMVNYDNVQSAGLITLNRQEANLTRYRWYAWWHQAVRGDDQLRQRVAWALAQLWVVARGPGEYDNVGNDFSGQPTWLGLCHYYDRCLLENAFGNYREIMEEVSVHPIMGVWLSHVRNRSATGNQYPDENYAREIMQLFSIGLNRLNPDGSLQLDANGQAIPTYTNDEIQELAQVFTGMTYFNTSVTDANFATRPINFHQNMYAHEPFHDKTTKELSVLGGTLPANQTVAQDVSGACGILFNHPNTGPFVSRILIQRLVKSNPSKAYLRRVASKFANNGSGVRGDMKAVIKAVLLDKEALESMVFTRVAGGLHCAGKGTEYSRLREPVLIYAQWMRSFPVTCSWGGSGNNWFGLPDMNGTLNQSPYTQPSVFNFYPPDYQPPGEITNYVASAANPYRELYAPEFQILTPIFANSIPNRLRGDAQAAAWNFNLYSYTGGTVTGYPDNYTIAQAMSWNFTAEQTLLTTSPATLVNHLDLLLCHGSLSDPAKNAIVSALNASTATTTQKTRAAILAVITSPDFFVDE